MLQKMGWKEGQGLGKGGNEGMVAPISTMIVPAEGSLGLGKSNEYDTVANDE